MPDDIENQDTQDNSDNYYINEDLNYYNPQLEDKIQAFFGVLVLYTKSKRPIKYKYR